MRNRVEVDQSVMAGNSVIKGTRIPVEKIIHLLGQGLDTEDVLKEYPNMEKEDFRALQDRM